MDPIITKQIENDLKKKTTDHSRFKSYDGSAERRFSLHLNHINEQYRILQTLAKKHGLTFPELSFDVIIAKGITVENEQIKALSDKVYVQFSHELSIVHKTNGLASGSVIMGCSMTRTAEACAPIWRDIIFYDDYAVYAVIKQVDGKVVTCSLKTESAYRIIIIPKFARDLLFSRKEWLIAQIDDAGNRLYGCIFLFPVDLFSTGSMRPNRILVFLSVILSVGFFMGHGEPSDRPLNNQNPPLCRFRAEKAICTGF